MYQLLFRLVMVLMAADAPRYVNPVMPGDHPDPSIIRVGDTYWATATTSQWAPIFPLLTSKDLVNWTQVGVVFQRAPEWSAGSYWAPEIAEDRGRFFVYYTARKKGGPLCLAVATADSPGGPYTDRGPMVCQDAGSIDAVPITDEKGARYLVWKEDGNSRKQPTPLWAQPLSDDGTKLIGEPREILRNEASWEAHLIEGPFIQSVIRRIRFSRATKRGNAPATAASSPSPTIGRSCCITPMNQRDSSTRGVRDCSTR
jgi:xylan 1,4-beta-xylosidase